MGLYWTAQPLFLSADDIMVEKESEKFELCSSFLTTQRITAPITSIDTVW